MRSFVTPMGSAGTKGGLRESQGGGRAYRVSERHRRQDTPIAAGGNGGSAAGSGSGQEVEAAPGGLGRWGEARAGAAPTVSEGRPR